MSRILIVCDGNICRSPYVEHALRARLVQQRVSGVELESAGGLARLGHPMNERSAAALRADGIDPAGFRSRGLDDVPALAAVDLVLTLERRHRAAVLDVAPSLLKRTFTLAEFTRAAVHLAESGVPVPRTGLTAVVAAVRSARLPGSAPDSDDVADPIRGDDTDHERFRSRVAEPIAVLAALLAHAHA
ncbi:hypothetical protein DEJ28_02755 [Curtobacterium sp. MCPF17_002]|uniref:arsenate-mycothiol transferase ArsC n=1 Tax=Curtobacterium sp. MCPF17_002 TaxID=2175645 RepID=UPI0015E8843E|nr:hypothetical protein [Curtobacterium sp. MCPF17_002]WIB78036.1 hypothetical protein DEJ28_02755 [Curtobacterium sp. MCPF17_002]